MSRKASAQRRLDADGDSGSDFEPPRAGRARSGSGLSSDGGDDGEAARAAPKRWVWPVAKEEGSQETKLAEIVARACACAVQTTLATPPARSLCVNLRTLPFL